MSVLTPDDVRRWDLGAIERVFDAATARAGTMTQLGTDLQQAEQSLSDWGGDSGDAFREEIGKIGQQTANDADQSKKVAAGAANAEEDVRQCKREMDRIDGLAKANRWTVTPTWQIDIGNTGAGRGNDLAFIGAWQGLQQDLDKLKVHADRTDEELADTMRSAVGDQGPDVPAGGPPPGTADNNYHPVTVEQLRKIVPELSEQRAEEIVGPLNDAMQKGGMNTPQRQAAFISQVAEESDRFATFEEYADGSQYEGRTDLGNTQPGDGPRYKGRGAIQVTGRYNYTKMSQDLGVDFVDHPEQAATPQYAFQTALWYWNTHDGNALADQGDIVKITEMVNGGHHGLAVRTEYYNRALQVLAQ